MTLDDIIDFMNTKTDELGLQEKWDGYTEKLKDTTWQSYADSVLNELRMDPRNGDFGIVGIGSIGKYPLKNRMTPKEFETHGASLKGENPLADATHLVRGRTGYLGGSGNYGPLKHELISDYNDFVLSKGSNKYDFWNEEISNINLGSDKIKEFLKGSESRYDKPLYLTREEELLTDFHDKSINNTLSTTVVDPIKDQYLLKRKNIDLENKLEDIYRIDEGEPIYNPRQLADPGEAVVLRDTLNKSKSMNLNEYLRLLRKGAAPFAATGLGLESLFLDNDNDTR